MYARLIVLGSFFTALSLACAAAPVETDDGNNITSNNDDDDDDDDNKTTCNATTCATGCCLNNQCFTDRGFDHCATGGVICPLPCPTGTTCGGLPTNPAQLVCSAPGAVVGPNTNFQVTLTRVVIDKEKDVYVNGGTFGSLTIPKTQTANNSKDATFNTPIGTLPSATLAGQSISVKVKAERFFILGDDTLGNCTYAITPADVTASRVTLTKANGCDGSIASVEFVLTPAP